MGACTSTTSSSGETKKAHPHDHRPSQRQKKGLAFEKRGVKLELFRRVAAECKSRRILSSNKAKSAKSCREEEEAAAAAAKAGCCRYVVKHVDGISILKGSSFSSDFVRNVEQGEFIDALPNTLTLGSEEGEYAGMVVVELLDGSGWAPLSYPKETFLTPVEPPPSPPPHLLETIAGVDEFNAHRSNRYIVTHKDGLPIRIGPSLSTDVVRSVKHGDVIDALPDAIVTLGSEEGQDEGVMRIQMLDGSGWTTLATAGKTFLELVGPVPEEPGYWTGSRVASLVVGNHEILLTDEKDAKEDAELLLGKSSESVYRWGKHVDPTSTLTFAGQSSLIEMIRRGHFEAHDAPLGGNLRYGDIVGAKADIFVSFAYQNDFIELVDALERFFENSPDLDEHNTYLWFDMFVNDQWTALEKPFEWWATTFKEAVEEIGHTVVVMLPWQAPIALTRVWCLFEIVCSKKLSIALSSSQMVAFHDTMRSDDGVDVVTSSLCNINVQKADAYSPDDKTKIFAVVSARKGGFHGVNVDVSDKMRKWVEDAARMLVEVGEEEEGLEALADLIKNGRIAYDHGNWKEAEEYYARALKGYERFNGVEDQSTLAAMGNLAVIFEKQGKLDEALALYLRELKGYESRFGLEHPDALHTMNNLGGLYTQQNKLLQAEAILTSCLAGCKKAPDIEKPFVLVCSLNLATVYKKQGKLAEAEKAFNEVLQEQEKTLGNKHPGLLATVNNLGNLFEAQGQLNKAEAMLKRALAGHEEFHGVDHIETKRTAENLARVQHSIASRRASWRR